MTISFPMFPAYISEGHKVTVDHEGFTFTATLYADDDHTPPDERGDGFWPSLDPNDPGFIGTKSASTLARHKARAQAVMDAWNADEWHYYGLAVTVSKAGVQLTDQYAFALWGIEGNYPVEGFGKSYNERNGYFSEVASELADEALDAARVKLAELVEVAA